MSLTILRQSGFRDSFNSKPLHGTKRRYARISTSTYQRSLAQKFSLSKEGFRAKKEMEEDENGNEARSSFLPSHAFTAADEEEWVVH